MSPRSESRRRLAERHVPHFYLRLNGEACKGIAASLEVINPYNGSMVATVSVAGRRQIREAITGCCRAAGALREMSRHKRAELLLRIIRGIQSSADELVDTLVLEGGKPRIFARQEVERTLATFTAAAEEARRFAGEQIPMDGLARGEGYSGYTERVPLGIVFGITPFNFPLNLVAHKVAPALASGNAVIIKPASATPISALILARIVSEADAPAGSLNVLPMRHSDVPMLLHSDHIRFFSFTGSAEIGWSLKQMAGRQRVALELGGNSGTYVDASADLSFAADRLALGGFAQAGQSCIAVQRIYVHRDVFDDLLKLLVAATEKLKVGNPLDDEVTIGPVISGRDADRIMRWIADAEAGGATVITGGRRLAEGSGQLLTPTILTGVKESMAVCNRELFGPVVTVSAVESVNEAVGRINASPFGLQAAVFSHDLRAVQYAVKHLDVGGIIVNDAPTYRVDHMPYGGAKQSGMGREGIRSAMLEMTEEKLIVTRLATQTATMDRNAKKNA